MYLGPPFPRHPVSTVLKGYLPLNCSGDNLSVVLLLLGDCPPLGFHSCLNWTGLDGGLPVRLPTGSVVAPSLGLLGDLPGEGSSVGLLVASPALVLGTACSVSEPEGLSAAPPLSRDRSSPVRDWFALLADSIFCSTL